MQASMLMCDFAEAINGKLYVQGGGWSDVTLPGEAPLNCAVALWLSVSWNETNSPHRLSLALLDHDSHPVVDPAGEPVKQEGSFEVGRPPGSVAGQDFNMTLGVRYTGLAVPEGAYAFVLEVDGLELQRASFRVTRVGST